jgi:hypothetical protein
MKRKLSAPIPGEHGAWSVLFGSFFVAWAAAAFPLKPQLLLLAISMTCVFLAHEPIVKLLRSSRLGVGEKAEKHWRKWLVFYLVPGFGGVAALLGIYRLWSLLPIGTGICLVFGLHLHLASRRQERGILGELLGIVGLSISALVTHYVALGSLEATAYQLWTLSALYFASGVLHVRMCISRFLKKQEFQKRRWQSLLFHTLLVPILGLTVILNWIPFAALLAYLPVLVRAFWKAFREEIQLNIKRIGYAEVGYTIFFVLVFTLGWHLG